MEWTSRQWPTRSKSAKGMLVIWISQHQAQSNKQNAKHKPGLWLHNTRSRMAGILKFSPPLCSRVSCIYFGNVPKTSKIALQNVIVTLAMWITANELHYIANDWLSKFNILPTRPFPNRGRGADKQTHICFSLLSTSITVDIAFVVHAQDQCRSSRINSTIHEERKHNSARMIYTM